MPALSQCCATGSVHAGKPTGTVTKVHGVDCYVAEPPSGAPTGIVVIIPDAFGWVFPNNRVLADDYAKAGFRVYLPEFMNGSSMTPDLLLSMKVFKSSGWLSALNKAVHMGYIMYYGIPFMISCRESVAGPRIYSFLKDLRLHEAKSLPVGVAGFCWGGLYVTRLCADTVKTDDGGRLVDCGFTAHPSSLKIPTDVEKVYLPYSVAMAEHDFMIPPATANQMKQVLEEKTARDKSKGIEHEYVFYEKAWHGFAVRCDEDEVFEGAQGKKAEVQAVEWFKKWFSKPLPETI